MKFEEFWKRYIKEDIVQISDEIISVFQERFPDEVYEEYDITEVLTEFTGHHKTANKYEKIEEFGQAVKNYHQELYEDVGGYINEALIRYYCFLRKEDKVKEQITDVLNRKNYDHRLLWLSIDQLLYNGYDEIVNMIFEQEYENISTNENWNNELSLELKTIKFYYEFEKSFRESSPNSEHSWDLFVSRMKEYNLKISIEDLDIDYLQYDLENQETKDIVRNLLIDNPKDKEFVFRKLEKLFNKKMLAHNCSLGVSRCIWEKTYEYFETKKFKSWKGYFKYEKESFRTYLQRENGFFNNNKLDLFLYLWGCEYILDFLNDFGLYENEEEYLNQIAIIKEYKEIFKSRRRNYLWQYNFVHKWKPSREKNIEDWKAEEEEFRNSYELEIKEEEMKDLRFDEFFGTNIFEDFDKSKINYVPVRTERKIGRNEKITVKYVDGTIKEEIKYKKVINDIATKKCEII